MSIRLAVTPSRNLIVESLPDDGVGEGLLDAAAAESLRLAFAESSGSGLVRLASRAMPRQLPPEFLFWREYSERFFHALCALGEETLRNVSSIAKVEPPAGLTLTRLVEDAPPMRGLEYLTEDVLRRLWTEIHASALEQAKAHPVGLLAWLQEVNSLWNLLGRVTFHLAENKRDPARPFAFLATYTHRVSAKAKLQHLPLVEALKQYADGKNQVKLSALLEPVQKAAQNCPLVQEMLDSRQLFQPHSLSIQQAHRFLSTVPEMENAGLVVRVPDWWKSRQSVRPVVQVRIGQKKTSQVGTENLMDFSVDVAVDGEPLTEKERAQILAGTGGLTLLRGQWVEVDQTKLQQALDHWGQVEQQHASGIDFIQAMRMLAGVRLVNDDGDEEGSGWTRVTTGDWLSETLERLRQPNGIVDCEPGVDLDATLRPYQIEGVRWLWFLTRLGLGACLADDMGLGKTIQVIDLLLTLKREEHAAAGSNAGAEATSLLIVPASLVGNWKTELERFAPTLNVLYAHPSECPADLLKTLGDSPGPTVSKYDVVVTTYGLARRFAWMADLHWRLIVLDEAQAIKNAASAQAKSVRKLKSSGRIAISGTPVENHLGELWSLFDFCCPGLLGNASQFKSYIKTLNKRQDANAYGALRKLVRPYILRRLKTDPGIAPDLPEKTEMRVDCGLSKTQIALYKKTLDELQSRLDSTDPMQRRGVVLSTLMQLKQICNHPSQFLRRDEYAPAESGKFQRLRQLCAPIVERQERMLVFTQFQSMTEPLADYLSDVFGRSGLVLHGGVAVKKRKQLVAEFQADQGPPFLVVSVKAGGTGLNLTAASHVVHFDRWWNPAVEDQATDRAFRIGQKRNVLVHKFVCRGTIEERIDQMIHDKRALADEILSGGAESRLTEMDNDELLDFVAIDLTRAGIGES